MLVFFIANEEMSSQGWLEHSPSPACCSLHYPLKLNHSNIGLGIFTFPLGYLFSIGLSVFLMPFGYVDLKKIFWLQILYCKCLLMACGLSLTF